MSFRIPISRLCAILPRAQARGYSVARVNTSSSTEAASIPHEPTIAQAEERTRASKPKRPVRPIRTYRYFPKDLFRCQPWPHFNLNARRDRTRDVVHDITVEHREQVATKDCRVFPWALEPWYRKAPNGFFLRENNKDMRYFMNHRTRMKMYIFVIEAGTPVPEDLLLVSDFKTGRWYLEPGRIMTLGDLNNKINTFMHKSAPKMTHQVMKKAFREVERKKHPASPWPPGYRASH